MQSELAQQNREIERLEDLIKQLSEDGGQTAPTKATHQPVPGISNAAVVAAVQADLQANDTSSTITNLGEVSENARKKFLADFAKTNSIKHCPNIKRNAERMAVAEFRTEEESSTFREKWFKAVKSTNSKPKINGKNVHLHPYLSGATVKLLRPLYEKCKELRAADSVGRYRVDLRDFTVKWKKKDKDTEESVYILTNEGGADALAKVPNAAV